MNKVLFSLLLCFSLGLTEEEDPLMVVKTRAETYFNEFRRTKLQLFFSQPYCAPGDTLSLGIVYLSANNLKPVPGRQIVHICLFDQFGKKQWTRWTDVNNGYASCELVIPKELQSGNYKLVAFTDWMKNFDQSLFFQQQFTIAGKFLISPVLPDDTLFFFPEGGSLIANLENNIAIRYDGKLDRVNVMIREEGKELTSLRLVKDSVQLFRFKPKWNARYAAEIRNESGVKSFSLPSVKPSGLTLQVENVGSRLRLNTAYSGSGDIQPQNLYVAIFNNNGLIFQAQLDFNDEHKCSLPLPANLPRGIAQLIVFDSKFDLLASRVIDIGRIDSKEVGLANLQANYSTRQEVKLGFNVRNKDGSAIPGYFSCRVVNADLFSNAEANEMDYLTFRSDISNPFGINRNRSTQQMINNYLITQSCPWFVWDKIIKASRGILFKPQQNLMVNGTATYAKNGHFVPDSTLIMFFLEKSLLGYETRTDRNGRFSFPLLLTVNHPDRFYYTATLKGKDVNDISIEMYDPDSALSFFAKPYLTDKSSLDQYAVYSSKVQTINSSYFFFANAMPSDSVDEPNKAIEEELNGADLTVNLSDYLMMPTMEDVVREIVRAVEYRKVGGKPAIRVYTIGKVTNYSSGPLFVIDGAITKDPSYFLGLKPADVISIKVVRDVRKLFALGSLGANGVILVKTKLQTKIVNEKHTLDFAGLLPESHRSFLGHANPKIPDLRPCTFWSSRTYSERRDEFILFKTSDDVGKFKIQISGLTEDGFPFFSEYPFQVKYSGN